MTKSDRQYEIVKGGKLQESQSSLICFVIAGGSLKALPVFINILAHFCIPVSFNNKYVLLRCLIDDILQLDISFHGVQGFLSVPVNFVC